MTHDDGSLEHHVSRREDFQLADIRSMLTQISEESRNLTRAVIGNPFDPHAPPGLITKLNDVDRRVNCIELIMTDRPTKLAEHNTMMATLASMAEANEKRGDRTFSVGWDIIRIVMAILVGVIGTLFGILASKGAIHL